MELRHLRYFVGVAETENVSRAALKLHISQPAVSRQIRDLEDEIGLPLLKRVGKSVRLTEAGRLFLNEARAILERTDEALRNAERARAFARSSRRGQRVCTVCGQTGARLHLRGAKTRRAPRPSFP